MNDTTNEQKLNELIWQHKYKEVLQLIDDTEMPITLEHWFTAMDGIDTKPINDDAESIFDYITYVYKNQVGEKQFKDDAKQMVKMSIEINDTKSLDILSKHGADEFTTTQLNSAIYKETRKRNIEIGHFPMVNYFLDKGVKADMTTLKHAMKINNKDLLKRIIIEQKIDLSDEFIISIADDKPRNQYTRELIGKALLNKQLETETCKPK